MWTISLYFQLLFWKEISWDQTNSMTMSCWEWKKRKKVKIGPKNSHSSSSPMVLSNSQETVLWYSAAPNARFLSMVFGLCFFRLCNTMLEASPTQVPVALSVAYVCAHWSSLDRKEFWWQKVSFSLKLLSKTIITNKIHILIGGLRMLAYLMCVHCTQMMQMWPDWW